MHEQLTYSMECSAQLIEVIWVSGMRGVDGSQRNVQQYWSKDGHLLAELDDVGCAPDSMGRTILRLQQEVEELRRRAGCNSFPEATPDRSDLARGIRASHCDMSVKVSLDARSDADRAAVLATVRQGAADPGWREPPEIGALAGPSASLPDVDRGGSHA